MGLNFTNKKIKDDIVTPYWSYSGFNRFRERLATSIGINLNEMDNFKTNNGTIHGNLIKGISWSTVKSPIKYLLNHSDCSGQISAKRCLKICKVLKDITKDWQKEDYDKQQCDLLCSLMEDCYHKNEPLLFI